MLDHPQGDLLGQVKHLAGLLAIGQPLGAREIPAAPLARLGLVLDPLTSERAGSGHRRYPRAVLRRVAFIIYAQRVGLTLEEIGVELAKLPAHHAPTPRDWSRLSRQWSTRIDERIAELQRLKSGLTDCIGCGCLSLDRCRLANPDDRAAAAGPGPRYWIGDRPLRGQEARVIRRTRPRDP